MVGHPGIAARVSQIIVIVETAHKRIPDIARIRVLSMEVLLAMEVQVRLLSVLVAPHAVCTSNLGRT